VWRSRLQAVQRDRERSAIELELRHVKYVTETANRLFIRKTQFKALSTWRARFKASTELKRAQEDARRRRELVERITPVSAGIERSRDVPKRSPIVKRSPKRQKVANVEADPRTEAMAKRMQEQRAKALEKAQKEAEAAHEAEEARIKEGVEAQKQKRLVHKKFLADQKAKRDEAAQRQVEAEIAAELLKSKEASLVCAMKQRLVSRHFRIFRSNHLSARERADLAAANYKRSLLRRGWIAFSANCTDMIEKRERCYLQRYDVVITGKALHKWALLLQNTARRKELVARRTDIARLGLAWNQISRRFLERQQEREHLVEISRMNLMIRRAFGNWTNAFKLSREEGARKRTRDELMSKALQYLDDLNSDPDGDVSF
jgi:hypothetical protein